MIHEALAEHPEVGSRPCGRWGVEQAADDPGQDTEFVLLDGERHLVAEVFAWAGVFGEFLQKEQGLRVVTQRLLAGLGLALSLQGGTGLGRQDLLACSTRVVVGRARLCFVAVDSV